MDLLDLPNDILVYLWDIIALFHVDVASFAATNKRLHQLGESALEDHRDYRDWRVLKLNGDNERYALDTLKKLIAEPEYARFRG